MSAAGTSGDPTFVRELAAYSALHTTVLGVTKTLAGATSAIYSDAALTHARDLMRSLEAAGRKLADDHGLDLPSNLA